jgi:3-phosphoshikimate 1-carboxyvinyltransferase
LATMMELEINNPAVVKKSYPRFWDDLKNLGFTIEAS